MIHLNSMLKINKNIRGYVVTSWLRDPQLLSISPHLSYLQLRPIERGAFSLKHGPGPIHTERAISNSFPRRRLYNEGKYLPNCYSIIWPRNSMIKWAQSHCLK